MSSIVGSYNTIIGYGATLPNPSLWYTTVINNGTPPLGSTNHTFIGSASEGSAVYLAGTVGISVSPGVLDLRNCIINANGFGYPGAVLTLNAYGKPYWNVPA
jgi:hypothetical protein